MKRLRISRAVLALGRCDPYRHEYLLVFGRPALTSRHGGTDSRQMNPTQKQFSLNRAASKQQFPISFSLMFG